MPLLSNYGTNQYPEYQTNAGADSANGRSGAMTPGAVRNQNLYRSDKPAPTRPPGDPYQNFKASAMEWADPQALSNTLGGAQPTATGAPQTSPQALSNVLSGTGVAPPTAPPVQPSDQSQTSNILRPGQDNPTTPNTLTPGQDTPVPNTPGPPPQGISPQTWSDANRWVTDAQAKGWDYSYLLQAPQLIDQFRAWQQAHGGQSVDPVDWLKAIGMPSPGAGRSGADTYAAWQATQTQGGGPPTTPPGGPQKPPNIDDATWAEATRWATEAKAKGWDYDYLTQHPEIVSQFRQWQQANGAQNVDPVDWLKHNGYSSPGAMRSGSDTFLDWYKTQHAGNPGTPSGPPTNPPVLPPAPVNPPPPSTAPPPVRQDPTNWKPTAYPGIPDDKTLATILGGYLNPAYKQGQDDLGAQLRGQAALTGDSNSGGFGEVFGRSEGRLIGEQNKDFADKLMTARTQEKDLAQQRYNTDVGAQTQHYQIDSNKFVQQLQNDTARYGIKTNSDMEKYLGDQKTALAAFGINVDAIMKQYQADLQLKGQQYGIDKNFDIQVFQDATNRYIADLNRQNQQDSNNLGWGQLGVQRYGIDTNAQLGWADLARQLGLSPQDLANILAGFTPGVAYHPPPGNP